MINKYYTSMLSEKDIIFEIFQYSQEKAKIVGAENIYDFSLGNPSVRQRRGDASFLTILISPPV